MIIFFLGRQPEIGLAELAAVYHQTPQLLSRSIAALDLPKAVALKEANRLGSVIKIAELVADYPSLTEINYPNLTTALFERIAGKITLGISLHSNLSKVKKDLLAASRISKNLAIHLKELGHSVRTLYNKEPVLSTATLLHNGLVSSNPKKVSLDVIVKPTACLIAKTIYVQDIDAYSLRDRKRPRRDARNGMLPPKLAQTMINLALGASYIRKEDGQLTLLDPFCGTGVILQEASLMKLNTMGTDLNPIMIANTKANLEWLEKTHHLRINAKLATADATNFDWQSWAKPINIDIVATETYLGRPYTTKPSFNELKSNISNCNAIISKFLVNLAPQLASGAGLCIGVPAWYNGDHINHLPCIKELADLGFVNKATGANLIYHRPGQFVGRELLVLQKL